MGQIDRSFGAAGHKGDIGVKGSFVRQCAIYCRVSTDDQDCDRQQRELVEYADRCGYDVQIIYLETASGKTTDRQQRKQAIALAKARKIDAILVSELTRWSRSTIDLLETVEQLRSYGCSLIAQNGWDFDFSTPHGKLIGTVMAGFAEFERALIVQRVKSGLDNAKAKGKILGRPREDTSDRCDRVNQLRAEGLSDRAIGKQLSLGKSTVNRCPRCPDVSEGMDW